MKFIRNILPYALIAFLTYFVETRKHLKKTHSGQCANVGQDCKRTKMSVNNEVCCLGSYCFEDKQGQTKKCKPGKKAYKHTCRADKDCESSNCVSDKCDKVRDGGPCLDDKDCVSGQCLESSYSDSKCGHYYNK